MGFIIYITPSGLCKHLNTFVRLCGIFQYFPKRLNLNNPLSGLKVKFCIQKISIIDILFNDTKTILHSVLKFCDEISLFYSCVFLIKFL